MCRSWWFASTAVPLMQVSLIQDLEAVKYDEDDELTFQDSCSTIGPLANVLSVASLVTPWRAALPNNGELPEGADIYGVGIADPRW
jgi:hypothetical protein